MQNSKPETIADLKINWNFSQKEYDHDFIRFFDDFREANPQLPRYNIIPGDYIFEFISPDGNCKRDTCFDIHVIQGDYIDTLMYFIHSAIRYYLKENNWNILLILSNFEKLEENKFRINYEMPF